jgi:NADH:ubiquinone oxidoreductase subunit 6 (subunit J)
MKIKEKKSILMLPIILFAIWIYWQVIKFNNSISSQEELAEPEIEHTKQFFEYIFQFPLYIFIIIFTYLLWRIIKANMINKAE